jgi:prenyltransferase beta subunit
MLPLSTLAGTAEGVSWLGSQQNANGSFGATPASLATPQQTTAEVVRALQLLGQQAQPVYAPALNYLYADAEVNTEFLARKIVAAAGAGSAVTPLITALLAHQNADGGFGDKPGHTSTAYDTALVVRGKMGSN